MAWNITPDQVIAIVAGGGAVWGGTRQLWKAAQAVAELSGAVHQLALWVVRHEAAHAQLGGPPAGAVVTYTSPPSSTYAAPTLGPQMAPPGAVTVVHVPPAPQAAPDAENAHTGP